jgi:hypothetical protein
MCRPPRWRRLGLQTDASQLAKREPLTGPQARDDAQRLPRAWHKTDDVGGPAGKYLVNDRARRRVAGRPGHQRHAQHAARRHDGAQVRRAEGHAVSYIIKGILDQKLPWALVLLGVMIAVTLELSFVPALAFAVGVYTCLCRRRRRSSSADLIRWLVDRQMRKKAGTPR